MENDRTNYLGPLSALRENAKPGKRSWRDLPWPFIIVVILPTLIAAIYFLFIASPIYVSEARFIVRQQGRETPSSLGLALQGVGLSTTQSDAFAVHEYITSRDALVDVQKRLNLRNILGKPGSDPISRFPRPWEGRADEDLYKGMQRFITVGYDSTNGISTLRVKSFDPRDARNLADGLLEGGENLVNRLNVRASQQAVADAEKTVEEAEIRLADAQGKISEFRNRQRYIDPARSALESSQVIGGLRETLANLQAERDQLAADAPSSPQLPMLDGRIAAYQKQIEAERLRVAGTSESLAPNVGAYEALSLRQELAGKGLAVAVQSLDSARLEARRQQLYLERVVNPNLPDEPILPQRLIAILAVFASMLVAYGVCWLLWAGVREHRQSH